MSGFLNTSELDEFKHDLLLWVEKLPVLEQLALKQARLDNTHISSRAWQASTPLIISLYQVYEDCTNLIADMTTRLTSKHGENWKQNLLYTYTHVDALNAKSDFPALYAHFTMLNNQVVNALRKPEDKYLAGNCVSCGVELFARKRDLEAKCSQCGTWNDLATTRAQLELEREEARERYTFTGNLSQITAVYNMFTGEDLMKHQVLKLLTNHKIRNVKTGKNMWIIDTRTIK